MHLGVAGGGRPRERAGAGPVGPGWFRPQAGQRPHLLLGPDPAGPDGPQWHPVRGAGPAAQVHLAVHRHRQAQPEQAQGPGGVRGQPPEPLRRPGLPGRVRRPLVVAAAADYFYSSAVKGAAASLALGTVPFVRSGGSSRDSLQFLKELAGSGWSVLIFPSGTRGTGASGFKKGFAYIAVDAQVPVVPMYLHGLDQVMPKGSFIPLPGGVVIGIGEPIPPGDDYNALVAKAEAGVAAVRTVVKGWEGA